MGFTKVTVIFPYKNRQIGIFDSSVFYLSSKWNITINGELKGKNYKSFESAKYYAKKMVDNDCKLEIA